MNQFSTEEQVPARIRRQSPWIRTLLGISGVLVFGAIATACSSSSATPTTATQAPGGGGGTTAALVSTTSNATLGTILVNDKGFTLYTLSGNAACDAACEAVWPPLLASAGSTPNFGGVSGMSTVNVSGGEQVTHNGMRLYTFALDKSAGQATGQGLKDTWGTWSVVMTQAASTTPTTTTPTTGPTTTTTAAGGGGVGF